MKRKAVYKHFKLGTGPAIVDNGRDITVLMDSIKRLSYLWVGDSNACFGFLSGTKRLRKLAHTILQAIGDEDQPKQE